MKEKDLMVGDWLKFRHGLNTVAEIAYDEHRRPYVSFPASATLFREPLEYVKPIEITPDILKENGFVGERKLKITTDQYMLTASEISDSVWKLDYDSNEFSSIHFSVHVCYVHELQHALRLFGVDKEIEL